jgi:hypothetical protein
LELGKRTPARTLVMSRTRMPSSGAILLGLDLVVDVRPRREAVVIVTFPSFQGCRCSLRHELVARRTIVRLNARLGAMSASNLQNRREIN